MADRTVTAGLRAFYFLYQILVHLLAVPVLAVFLWRSQREPLYRARLHERFGLGPVGEAGAVWVFAASLGETRAAAPLIGRLLDAGHAVCLTHSSPAGLTAGMALLAHPKLTNRYVPLDLFWAVRLFVGRLKPSALLIAESELWPGQILETGRRGIPVIQINGNLVQPSLDKATTWARRQRLGLLTRFDLVLTKSPDHAKRYQSIGVPEHIVRVTGETKFDQSVPVGQIDAAQKLRTEWSARRPVFLIASSVAVEEEALLGIVTELLSQPQRPRIVWVPRSPQRFDAVFDRLKSANLDVSRRSQVLNDTLCGAVSGDVLLGDSLGEMGFYCALADLVFVGASLSDDGGHNIVEPISLGRPVIMGPSIYGISFPGEEARDEGALRVLPDATHVASEVRRLLENPEELAAFSKVAREYGGRHVGASIRSLAEITPLIRSEKIAVRRAEPSDAEVLLRWRNDPATRAASLNTGAVNAEDHQNWFARALADPDRQILIGEIGDDRIGMVRFDRRNDVLEVSINLAPSWRGRGLGGPLLSLALGLAATPSLPFQAEVRKDNTVSLRLFQNAGFRSISDADPAILTLQRAYL